MTCISDCISKRGLEYQLIFMGNCGGKSGSETLEDDIIPSEQGDNRNDNHKVVLVGDKAVGKSSIVLRYTKNHFSEGHTPTIGAAFVSKDLNIHNTKDNTNTKLRLHLWDTAGEEHYRAMTRFFYREADIGVVVYDITDKTTFNNIDSWITEFKEQCPDAHIVIAGNKSDMDENRAVTTSTAKKKKRRNLIAFM